MTIKILKEALVTLSSGSLDLSPRVLYPNKPSDTRICDIENAKFNELYRVLNLASD